MGHSRREIENPVTDERVVFIKTAAETEGELFVGETRVGAGSPAQPLHIHPTQESVIEVLAGTAGFQLGRRKMTPTAGEKLVTPPGTAHKIWNAGADELRYRFEYRPALPETELFFENFFGLARDGKTDKHGMPSLLQIAVMAPRYSRYIRLAQPPWAVQRALFALLGPLGRRRGYRVSYAEYSAASTSPSPEG